MADVPSTARPRLRNVDAFPVEQHGRRFLALRDPAGYTESVLLIPIAAVPIVALFDGAHTIAEIQAEVARRHGEAAVDPGAIAEILRALDEHGFIDSPRFAERRAAIDTRFLAGPRRPAAHAGGAYVGDPDALRAAIDRFFDPPTGPGPMTRELRPDASRVSGVIAPHIDYHRGGPGYGWAYRDVGERCDADLFVIFGTCHAGMHHPFAMTRKDWETPLGTVRVDRESVDAIARRSGADCFGSEISHRTEHSIELQVVFLQYLFGSRRDFTIVPVLTSFAHEALARGRRPDAEDAVARFLDTVGDVARASGRRVAYVAGADLAHVGPRFGDHAPLSADDLQRVEREDREMLRAVQAGDARAFFESVAADGDRRRICGLSPIYALLHVLGGRPGALRHYGMWPDPEAVVTYASVVF